MKFIFKYASRSRPEQFKENISKWLGQLSRAHTYQFLCSFDNDDRSMNNDAIKNFCSQLNFVKYYFGDNKNKIEAINADMEKADPWDYLVVVSDDMRPEVHSFDCIIDQEFQKHSGKIALNFDDGEEKRQKTLCTLSIMNRELYDYFGYIYNPIYKSFFCDREYSDICHKNGWMYDIPQVIVRHLLDQWIKEGQDPLYAVNAKYWQQDLVTFSHRNLDNFPKVFRS